MNDKKEVIGMIRDEVKALFEAAKIEARIIACDHTHGTFSIDIYVTRKGLIEADKILTEQKRDKQADIERILHGDLYPSEICDLTGMDLKDAGKLLEELRNKRITPKPADVAKDAFSDI